MSKSLVSFNNDQRLVLWAERIAACRNSGLTVTKWCSEQNIALTTYYHWQKRVFEAVNKSKAEPTVQFSELRCSPSAVALESNEPVATISTTGVTAVLYPGVSPVLAEALCRGLTNA